MSEGVPSIYHLTVETGHGALIDPARKDGLRDALRQLRPLATSGRVNTAGFQFQAVAVPGGWRFDAGVAGQHTLVTCYVAAPGGGDAVWRQMTADRKALGYPAATCRKPSQEPWLTAMLRDLSVGSLEVGQALQMLATWEQGVAWALLKWGKPLPANAPMVGAPAALRQDRDDAIRSGREMLSRQVAQARLSGVNGVEALAESRTPRLKGTLASAILARAAERGADRATQDMAATVKECPRFAIAAPLIDRAETMRVEPAQIAEHWGRLVRLPHDPMWIEYSPREIERFSDHAEFAVERCGFLLRKQGERLEIGYAFHFRGDTNVMPGHLSVGPDGIRVEVTGYAAALYEPMRDSITTLVLRLILLLNARNAPITVGQAEDMSRLNRARAKQGKPPALSTAPIAWNLTRYERLARRTGQAFGAQQRQQTVAALVRGHHKIRMVRPRDENGRPLPGDLEPALVWWAPHVRSAAVGLPENGRDYSVKGGPGL